MQKTIGIIGGDLRIIRLCEILSKENYILYTYGLEKYHFVNGNILSCNSIQEITNNCEEIIGGIPFSKDGIYLYTPFSSLEINIKELIKQLEFRTIIAGGISKYVEEQKDNIKVIDLLQNEELTVLNVIPTVEGAIKVAIENTEFTLHGSNCLILGFGRIGKLLAKSLLGLGAKVSCMARKPSDIAWIEAYGYNKIDINDLEKNLLNNYDIIFNTIPAIILDRKKLEIIKQYETIIIELASKPWGEDFDAAQEFGIRIIKAPGLPGKVAPLTSAMNIKRLLNL